MLPKGQCVWCARFGLGQIVRPGPEPLVRLVGDSELWIPEEQLTPVPASRLEREIENRTNMEIAFRVRMEGPGAVITTKCWDRDEDGLWIRLDEDGQPRRLKPHATREPLDVPGRIIDAASFRGHCERVTVERVVGPFEAWARKMGLSA